MRLDSKDNRTCIANEQVLLFIMGDEIRGIDLMQPNHHTIPTIRQSPQVSYNYVMFICQFNFSILYRSLLHIGSILPLMIIEFIGLTYN